MKKSLVAVLLSLVALTLVAGAAFAGGASFDVTVKVTLDGEAGTPVSVKGVASPDAFKAEKGLTLSEDVIASTTVSEKVTSTIGFALSEDKTADLAVFVADGEKLGEAVDKPAEITITADTDYFLVVSSGDVSYAIKASVTISGSEEEKGNPTTVDKASDKALAAAKAKFPDGTKMFDASVFESALTSKDYAAIKDDLANLALYTTPATIDSDGAIIFKIKLTGIDKGMLLKWVSILLDSIVTGDAVTISAATEIPVVYYFDDATGNEIMLNDVTTADNQEVDVAFAVTAGRQVFGVSSEKAATSGGSPSSGCDMGLLGSLALFAVALLPLRKSK